ncbi:MAG: amino acid adenylation domain-containing protein [Pseudoxanthomonas sp.]
MAGSAAQTRPQAHDAVEVDYNPFADGELLRVVPTTEPQREVWLADQLGQDASLAFNESVSLRLRGALDVDALQAALHALVNRHDVLRASFGPDGETLCVLEHNGFSVQRLDLASLGDTQRAAAVNERLRLAVESPFTLGSESLFRAELLQLAGDEHLLVLTAHHIVCDGWSWWVMVRELGLLYAQSHDAADAVLPPPQSFGDYALAQAVHPADTLYAEDEAYWLSRFRMEAPVLDLPVDRPRPAQRSFASKREDYVLDGALVSAIRAMGARRGVSLFATLLAGFGSLLSRLAAQSDVVIGIPAAGQSVDGHDQLVGHCVNLLPLRCDIPPAKPFALALDEVQTSLLDAIEHQRYTFGTLLKKLRVNRDPARMPLVSVMFNIDQALDQQNTSFTGLSLDFASNARSFENFELFINAVQAHGELRLECQYNTDLFDPATVRRWMQAYECLLRNAVQNVDAAIGSLPIIGHESMQALAALQPTPTAFAATLGMHQLFETQCDRTPDRIALRYKDESLTYAQLDERANRIASLLRAHGVHAGALVGLALDRGVDMLAGLLGILKTGAGYVPLDPAFPQERLTYMVGDAGLAALITQRSHASRFDLRGRPVLTLETLVDELAQASPLRAAAGKGIDPESIAYVIYTSGSTGKPKGVQVPHRAVANFIGAMQASPGIEADDKLVAVTTLSFDIAVLELMLPLSVGAEVILADRETAMDGQLLSALLRVRGATLMQATPATWRVLIDAGWRGSDTFRVLCGGEPLPLDLARALIARSGALWNLYGPTETTVWSTACRVQDPERGISIGTPIANTTVWVLDPQGQPCPLGVPGELCIGGEGVTLGYLGREDLTADRFVADTYSQHAGYNAARATLYRTGDRGRWRADGQLEHMGRLDFQVKVRGYRIELGEIEAALTTCPGIAQAVVLVREDRPGDVRLVGYVVALAGADIDERNTIDGLKRALPEYMVPQHVVILDAVPLLPNGKIDRKALPAPDLDARREELVLPRNDLERAIAASMAQVLGLPQISIHDNFFAFGGHSLLAAQLTSRLNRELGSSLTLRALFDGPTVAGLAEIASGTLGAPARKTIERQQDQSTAPLSLMQERLWLLEQFTPGQVTYNTPSGHRLRGPLDVAVFERAFDALVQRQSVLRTSVGTLGGEAFQIIHDNVGSSPLPVVDLGALPAERREQAALDDMRALVQTPFDLGQAPLFVARLYRLADDEHLFFFMAHHAIWDGWSFDLLYSDLSAFYAAFLSGREPELPELPVSYGDFSAWHREWVDGPEYAKQRDFWRERLGSNRDSGEDAMRAMPTDMPRRPGMSGGSNQYPVFIPRDLSDELHAAALKLDSTLFVTMLTAYFALMCGVSGQRDLIVATPVRGRNSDETENLMGYFTNLLPLRVRIDPAQPFVEALRNVKSVLLDSFANPDIRLEDLMRELTVHSAGGGGQVLYHAMFSFQDVRQRNLEWGNVQHERIEIADPGATQDLGLWLVENERGLAGAVVFNSDTLLEDTAAMLARRYHGMLQALALDPSQSIQALTRFNDGLPAMMGRNHDVVATTATTTKATRTSTTAERTDEMTGAPSPAFAAVGASSSASTLPGGEQNDALTTEIARIWSELLGHDRISLDDDFFALGGHSLQAVQMFHRIGRKLKVNLPLATLFMAPTVRLLAAAYRQAGAQIAGAGGAACDPWAPLVPIRPGNGPTPLFLAHAVGGNCLNYRALAVGMPTDMPVYGLQALGLDGRTPPLECIEEMAARYVDEIRKVQPVGPYYLAGGSMGGMIAYEMAQQLSAVGEEIAMLGLIDTSSSYGQRLRAQAANPPSKMLRLRRRLQGLSVWQALRAMANMPRLRLAAARDRRRVVELRRQGEPVPHDLRYADVEASHLRAYRNYVVRPYPGKVTLFRAEDQDPTLGNDPSLGWKELVGDLVVFSVPGTHRGIVEKPELQATLTQALEAVLAGTRVATTATSCPSRWPSPALHRTLEQNA